jgi:N-acetylmuramic acid 6-phosphate etherase
LNNKRTIQKPRTPRGKEVFEELKTLLTENSNPKSNRIDRLSTRAILHLINSEDMLVAKAIAREIPNIAKAVEMALDVFKNGGRLFYLGAGTSGRLGMLDAAECPPTFGTDPKMIRGIIAGGYGSLVRSREGVEDDVRAAIRDIKKNNIGSKDMVMGITASRRTPYVLEGLRNAKSLGAKTIFLSCNPRRSVPQEFDLTICPIVGPEVIAGSSRMKAGTAQKMVLNMISTAAMIRMGKVYGNRMVDLRTTSEKLKERSKKVIIDICNLPYDEAEMLLKSAGGSVKTAIIMAQTGLSKSGAERLLRQSDGFVYKALKAQKAASHKRSN